MASPTPKVEAARRKYAKLVANIDDAHYPLFQAAITGRAALEGAAVTPEEGAPAEKRGSMLDLGENNADEKKKMRNAMVMQEGLMEALFQILRNVPRRMLMLFKVNDLNRFVPFRSFSIISSRTHPVPSFIALSMSHYKLLIHLLVFSSSSPSESTSFLSSFADSKLMIDYLS